MARHAVHVVNGTVDTVTTVTAVTDITNTVKTNPYNTDHAVDYTHYQTDVLVTNTAVRAASAGRVACSIQNVDATNPVYIRVDGQTATAAIGVKIAPGELYELPSPCSTEAINGIATGGTVSVHITEGVVS
jgi:hypothetical protein